LQIQTDSEGKAVEATFIGTVEITAADEATHKEFVSRWLSSGRDGILYELLRRVKSKDLSTYSDNFPRLRPIVEGEEKPRAENSIYSAVYDIKRLPSTSNSVSDASSAANNPEESTELCAQA
jgi:hypothetical protein